MNPVRIQRKRTKGWKSPPNTKYVGRPTRYGNPFMLLGDMIYCDASHRRTILSPWVIYDHDNLYSEEEGRKKIVELYEDWLWMTLPVYEYANHGKVKPPPSDIMGIISELKGKNLSCWCPRSLPCHADILLKIANE